jgi:hypothetical protein
VVNFVQKDFLGSISEFRNQYVIPIQNGQHQDASRRDVIMMKRRVKHLLEYALLAAVSLAAGCCVEPHWLLATALSLSLFFFLVR